MPKGDRAIGKADPDDGTTPIANLLLEALILANLSSKERAAVLFLIRRTYGWQIKGKRLKADVIPLSVWARILQVKGITRASRILSGLVKKSIFNRESLGPGKSYIYTINTTIANWNNCINQQLLSEMTTLVLPKMRRVALSEMTTPSATDSASPKENINKDNIKKYGNEDRDAQKIWNDALNKLKAKVNRSNYETWLKNTVGLSYNDNEFIVGVPSSFVADYLREKQRSLIERTLGEVTQPDVKVSFTIKGVTENENPVS